MLLLLARVTGLLGGLAWIVRWFLGDGAAADPAHWTGSALIAVSLAAYGGGLVRVAWLRVVVGLALPVLVWSVLVVLRDGPDAALVDALVGVGMVLVAVLGWVRQGRRSRARSQTRSQHRSQHRSPARSGSRSASRAG
ncbi:hypothetical protein [Nocardioides sp. SYSU DS0663]|uniref:hypothetical protein n=1 Tax=Nocardioides sp. SYSU DS0663 TaxID=3416445 RepID=UPI003F4B5AB4